MRRLAALLVATTAILGSSLVSSGCGTVLGHSGMQDLEVHLNPDDPDATIRVNGIEVAKGARRVQVDSRRESNTIDVTCPDGRFGKGTVTREVHTGVVIADAFMLIFPIYIDYANGGLYRMQKDLLVNLGKVAPSQPDPEPTHNPTKPGTPAPTSNETKPCSTCGEPRPVNSETCPHCGLK